MQVGRKMTRRFGYICRHCQHPFAIKTPHAYARKVCYDEACLRLEKLRVDGISRFRVREFRVKHRNSKPKGRICRARENDFHFSDCEKWIPASSNNRMYCPTCRRHILAHVDAADPMMLESWVAPMWRGDL